MSPAEEDKLRGVLRRMRGEPETPAEQPPAHEPPAEEPTVGTAPRQPQALPAVRTEPPVDEPPVDLPPVEYKRGHLQIPNTIVFSLWPLLKNDQRLLYEELYLFTHGFGENPRIVSQARVCRRLGWEDRRIRRVLSSLVEKGFVRNLGTQSSGPRGDRGTLLDVRVPQTPGATPPRSATPGLQARGSERDQKEKTERHETPSVYDVRAVAARLFEVHRHDAGFDAARLRALVRDALVGQGRAVDESVIDEATRGMAG